MKTTYESISIAKFLKAIKQLPSDPSVVRPNIWYLTQKEHWIGWLSNYHSPGGYGRQVDKNRTAKYAYNHIVNSLMLLWINKAAGVDPKLIKKVQSIALKEKTLMAQSAIIRKSIPWTTLADRLWPEINPKKAIKKAVSPEDFLKVIKSLPEDFPVDDPNKWYKTQREHWIGWVSEYEISNVYGRKHGESRDAKFIYNHIVEPKMLLWFIDAAGVDSKLVKAARLQSSKGKTMMQKSGIIRKLVPWETVSQIFWQLQ